VILWRVNFVITAIMPRLGAVSSAVEQLAFNQLVDGSIPSRPTNLTSFTPVAVSRRNPLSADSVRTGSARRDGGRAASLQGRAGVSGALVGGKTPRQTAECEPDR
jgi:hypothetical protein